MIDKYSISCPIANFKVSFYLSERSYTNKVSH